MLLRSSKRHFTPSRSNFPTVFATRQRLSHNASLVEISNRGAYVKTARGQIVTRDAGIPESEEKEILFKVQACALQLANAKIAKLVTMPMEYPVILGSPVARFGEALRAGFAKVTVGG